MASITNGRDETQAYESDGGGGDSRVLARDIGREGEQGIHGC